MVRLTPAGNPAGRFLEEQYAALDAVFAAAAPLKPGKIEIRGASEKMSHAEALIWVLGELDAHDQSNSLVAGDLTASELSKKFHAIASAAAELLRTLGDAEDIGWLDVPEQIRSGLKYFAAKEAEEVGGFPNHPPETHHPVVDDEEVCYTIVYPERQLQQNIEGISQLLRWARQAEKESKLASSRTGKGSEEAARARVELAYSNMEARTELNICYEIFKIWSEVLGKPLRRSVVQGKATGPLIRFTTACLELLGFKPPSDKPVIDDATRKHVLVKALCSELSGSKPPSDKPVIDGAIRRRVLGEAIFGVDEAAPVIDDAIRRRVIEEAICLKSLGFKPPSGKPVIDDTTMRRVFAEAIFGVDEAAPVIDDATRRRVIEAFKRGRTLPSNEAIKGHLYRYSQSERSK